MQHSSPAPRPRSGLIAGAACPLRALGILRRHPSLWRYIIVPILLSVIAAALIYGVLLFAGLRAIDRLLGEAEGVTAALAFVLQFILVVSLLIVAGFLLVRIGVVLGSPWYSRLSERIEQLLIGGQPGPPTSPGRVWFDLARAVGYEARKLLLILGVGAPLLAINVIPGLGQALAAAGGLALGATIACLDFFEGPLERRRRSFGQKLGFIRRTLPGSAGFGLACTGLLAVPVVNLLALPVCVAGGTLFFVEHQDRDLA
ncbi:MAG TPA: EI24 domain-containing protein [Egibacteraceae bacterium]|nr:EI24 domain-containing protein [Egibacteraceae bacterium]